MCPKRIKKRALVVRHEHSCEHYIVDGLEKNDYVVSVVENNQHGIEILTSTRLDVVITEIYMPNMDGLEIIQAVRKLNSSVPIIIILEPDGRYSKAALKFGANYELRKPFLSDELVNVVGNCIAQTEKEVACD